MKIQNVQAELSKQQVKKLLADESLSKSAKIKALFESGIEIKEIANMLDIRYNFAYNVISNYVNMNGIQVETSKKENKKDKIIEMYLAGSSNKEISIELKTNYNYVFNTLKQYKLKQQELNESKEA